MADTQLVLGGISFSGFEIPESINFGGSQRLAVHDLIGADRVVDAMGPKPAPIKWKGRFRGPTALVRSQALDALCQAGAQIPLSWFNIFRKVVISEYRADTQRFYEIPYEITCEVVDFGQGAGVGQIVSGLSGLLSADMASAAQAAAPGPAGIAATIQPVSDAIDAAPGFTAPADILPISVAALTASRALGATIALDEASLGAAGSAAGGAFPPDVAAFVIRQALASDEMSTALDTKAYIDRLGRNADLART